MAGAVVRWRVVACTLLGCLWLQGSAAAQPQTTPLQIDGRPALADSGLRDREFGVVTRHLGLQRHVEMYQWQRQGTTYRAGWKNEPINSEGYDPAHANPGAFPVQTRYWIAQGLVLDGKPVDEEVLKTLGQWQPFRPNFSRLPSNLAATFQPEGDGLGSADDPLTPAIGDLRITWQQLVLPDLAERLELRDGRWMPRAAAAPGRGMAAGIHGKDTTTGGWLTLVVPVVIGIGLFAVVLIALLLRRKMGKRPR